MAKPFFLLTTMLGLALTSCDKHNILNQEREKLDAERLALQQQAAEMDRQLQSMPDAYNLNILQRKLEDVERKASGIETEAAAKMRKWEDIEARFLPIKKEAEAYRAKNNL